MTLFVSRLVSIATPIMLCACAAAHAAGIAYPESPKKPETDTYHGVSVSEDYRWLEENDATVKAWSAAQLRLARSQLDAVPGRVALKARLKDLYGNAPVKHYDFVQRGALFAMKRQPPKNQPFLVMMKSPNDVNNARVIVDPNKLNAKGTTAIDFYAPSIDGKYVAVSLSENGSEDGSVYVFETATGKKLNDIIPRVQYPTGGGSVAWNESGSGFYYTRYPQGSERASEDSNFYQQVYFHTLGTPSGADTYAIGKEFPRIAETKLSSSRDGRYVLASVANGDGGEFSFHLKNPAGQWVRVADHADLVREIEIGEDGKLYALSLKDSPRGKILVLPIDNLMYLFGNALQYLLCIQPVCPCSNTIQLGLFLEAGNAYFKELIEVAADNTQIFQSLQQWNAHVFSLCKYAPVKLKQPQLAVDKLLCRKFFTHVRC